MRMRTRSHPPLWQLAVAFGNPKNSICSAMQSGVFICARQPKCLRANAHTRVQYDIARLSGDDTPNIMEYFRELNM